VTSPPPDGARPAAAGSPPATATSAPTSASAPASGPASASAPASGPGLGRALPLALPAAYLAHLAEEVLGGPGFVAWMNERLAPGFTLERFVAINLVVWPLALGLCLAAALRPRWAALAVPVATALFVNGLLHLAATLAFAAYSPGTATGLVLYLPLGATVLHRASRLVAPRAFALAIASGLAAHAAVALAATAR
jgi:hypothetical protein